MNKGIDMAKGKVIAILNSDDLFAYDTVLKDIFLLYSQGYDIIYSDLLLKDFIKSTFFIFRLSFSCMVKVFFNFRH